MYPAHNRMDDFNHSDGFTLIELMVAITIFAIGMLGLAALQAQGLKYNSNAYERSQAVLLAYDMADRIRANVGVGGANALYGSIATPLVAATCVNTTCTSNQMAAADEFEWLSLVALTLPGGVGTVTSAGNIYTVTINWTGKFGASSHSLAVRP
jgi:type IV pilus assembly protein PilV